MQQITAVKNTDLSMLESQKGIKAGLLMAFFSGTTCQLHVELFVQHESFAHASFPLEGVLISSHHVSEEPALSQKREARTQVERPLSLRFAVTHFNITDP